MFFTTLNRIRAAHPCSTGWEKLLHHLGKTRADDEPLSLLTILESNGISDAIWALRSIDDCPEIRLFAVRCVRQIQHFLIDIRSLDALDVAELYAVGGATDEDLAAAWAAAWDAAWAPAWEAAWAAAWYSAWDAAWAAARAVARAAARHAARDAAWDAAWAVARAAARDAARDAAWDVQRQDFIDIFCS